MAFRAPSICSIRQHPRQTRSSRPPFATLGRGALFLRHRLRYRFGDSSIPNYQLPTPNHFQFPIPNLAFRTRLGLGVGRWEWLVVGTWKLGIEGSQPVEGFLRQRGRYQECLGNGLGGACPQKPRTPCCTELWTP